MDREYLVQEGKNGRRVSLGEWEDGWLRVGVSLRFLAFKRGDA